MEKNLKDNHMLENQYHLFKTRRFLPLFITQFLNAFNDNVFKNALVVLITYQLVQSVSQQQSIIALAGGVFILPFFLFSATAGQLADKYEKFYLIRWIKFLEILFMIVGTIGFFTYNIFLLMTTLFFLGCHSTFFGPIKYAILPDLLHKPELLGGNALIEAGTFVAILLGQILGGNLIVAQDGLWLISISLLTIAISGFISCFSIPKTRIGQPNLVFSFNILRETWRIIKLTRAKKNVFLAILGISWFWFIGATLITQFPSFIKEFLRASSSVFTLFLTIFSLGIGFGSLLCNKLLKGQITTAYAPVALLGMSIFLLDLFSAAHNLSPAQGKLLTVVQFISYFNHIRILLDVFALTACGGIFVVPLYAYIQAKSEEAIRSRVIACNNIINALFMVFSAVFVIGGTALRFTIPQLFLVLAIGNLFVTIII